jgi:hypothetical protein
MRKIYYNNIIVDGYVLNRRPFIDILFVFLIIDSD